MTAAPNPYVGPRSFEEEDRPSFFGREEEIHRLRALAVARRAVLLYSPSGAGKTSLLQAGLLPELRRVPGVVCLPLARVGGEPPEGLAVANLFVFHLLSFLLGTQARPEEIAPLSLAAGLERVLGPLAASDGAPPSAVLLSIDQFEEIFSTAPHRHTERDRFFQQLHEAFETHRSLTLLLALREDWLAHFDPHLPLLPDRLRTRFRLELLSPAQALQAVTEPARREGTPFRPAAARRLVDDLRRTRVLGSDGSTVESLGAHVDPVQLQVVCRRLWDRRPAGALEIDEAQIEASGDVDHALADYYAERVAAAAAEAGVPERRVRDWCERSLITPQGIRGQVLRGAATTGDLDNRAVTALIDAHLVRAEPRRGALWIELAHDRLIRPVQESNAAWLRQHETALEKRAALWELEGRPARLLLRGRPLTAAQKEAESLGTDPPQVVVDFLAASRARQRVRRKWWFWGSLGGGSLLLVLLAGLVLLGVAWFANFIFLLYDLRTHAAALRSARIDRSLLLALGAFEVDQHPGNNDNMRSHMPDPRTLLVENLAASSQLETILYAPEGSSLTSVSWRPDGRSVLAVDAAGKLHTWDVATGSPRSASSTTHPDTLRPKAPPVPPGAQFAEPASSLALSADGRILAAGFSDGSLVLLDAATGRTRSPRRRTSLGTLVSLAISPRGDRLAVGGTGGGLQLWDLATMQPAGAPLVGVGGGLHTLAFSPDGTRLASGHRDRIGIWFPQTHPFPGKPVAPPLLRVSPVAQGAAVATHPGGKGYASGNARGEVTFWNRSQRRRRDPWIACWGSVESLTYAPGGTILIAGCAEGTVEIFREGDLPENDEVVSLPGHGSAVHRLAASPDGRLLASADREGSILLWDIAIPRFVAGPFRGHSGMIEILAFNPTGKELVSVDSEGKAIRWDVDPDSWRRLACRRANRNLDADEWERYFFNFVTPRKLCPDAPEERHR